MHFPRCLQGSKGTETHKRARRGQVLHHRPATPIPDSLPPSPTLSPLSHGAPASGLSAGYHTPQPFATSGPLHQLSLLPALHFLLLFV